LPETADDVPGQRRKPTSPSVVLANLCAFAYTKHNNSATMRGRSFPGTSALVLATKWQRGDQGRPMRSPYIRERAKQRLALGQCAGCGHSPLVTKNHCARCRDLTRAAAKRRRERLKAAGMCFECGRGPAEAGVLRCARCAEIARMRSHCAYLASKATARLTSPVNDTRPT
jgi:hypothetical protein